MSGPEFKPLARAVLRVWPKNPRKIVSAAALDELTESVRGKGVKVPLLVRPLPEPLDGVTHEIIGGQRRFLAAERVGLDELPCMVDDLDDAAALELALLENSAREDVDPIEEAEAIESLIVEHKRDPSYVASKLGHSVGWVEKRRVLLGLCETARSWVRARSVPLAHAQALAVTVHDVQAAVVGSLDQTEIPSFRVFLGIVRQYLHDLSRAPFDTTDAKLAGGPCAKCPKRSDRQVELFAAAPNDGASCLDPKCWEGKVAATWAAAQKSAKKRKLEVIDDPRAVFAWGESPKYDGAYTTAAHIDEGIEVKPVAIGRTEAGKVVELYDRAAVEAAQDAARKKPRKARGDDEDGADAREPKGPSKWELERAESAERSRAWLARIAQALKSPAGAATLFAALFEADNERTLPELGPALVALDLPEGMGVTEIPRERLLDVILLALASDEIDCREYQTSTQDLSAHEAWVRRACGESADAAPAVEPEAQPAEGPRRLTLKRSEWQKHRTGLLDAKGLALHKRWAAVGENRELVIEPGADLDTVLAYAAGNELALDVRAEGVPALDDADEDAA